MHQDFEKILVVSDSHRKDDNLKRLIDLQRPFKTLIHLGDSEGSEKAIRKYAGPDVTCYFVEGNNDFFSDLPRDIEIMIGDRKCLLTHGHYYGVSLDVTMLSEEAQSRGCQIALFGHTHKPFMKEVDGVLCMNPGSISYPRQADRRPSYMIIEVDRKGVLHFTQSYISSDYSPEHHYDFP